MQYTSEWIHNMQSSDTMRSFTVRLPASRYEAVKAIARRSSKSVNAIVNDRLDQLLSEETERALEQWFDQLGTNAAEADVEYAFRAQSEVVLRDAA